MAHKVVNLSDFAKVLKADNAERLEKLRQATIEGIAQSIPDLVRLSPVDTGQYAASWDFEETEQGAIVGNYAPHAAIIEYGARPFTPPIKPLLAWAKRVLNDSSQPPDYSSQVWALAKYTQNKISEFGMEPKHILESMIPVIIENIKEAYFKRL